MSNPLRINQHSYNKDCLPSGSHFQIHTRGRVTINCFYMNSRHTSFAIARTSFLKNYSFAGLPQQWNLNDPVHVLSSAIAKTKYIDPFLRIGWTHLQAIFLATILPQI